MLTKWLGSARNGDLLNLSEDSYQSDILGNCTLTADNIHYRNAANSSHSGMTSVIGDTSYRLPRQHKSGRRPHLSRAAGEDCWLKLSAVKCLVDAS
jgi:hypothetical protein